MLAEHFVRGTESFIKWCNKCSRATKHLVSDGRAGRCMEHEPEGESKKQQQARIKREHEERNPKLF